MACLLHKPMILKDFIIDSAIEKADMIMKEHPELMQMKQVTSLSEAAKGIYSFPNRIFPLEKQDTRIIIRII